jgi:hypothetical protein
MQSAIEVMARACDPASVGPVSAPALPLGYRRLLVALIDDLFLCRDCHSRLCQRQKLQDEAWVKSEAEESFSFRFVCSYLGLDPTAVRAAYFTAHANQRDRIPACNGHAESFSSTRKSTHGY